MLVLVRPVKVVLYKNWRNMCFEGICLNHFFRKELELAQI